LLVTGNWILGTGYWVLDTGNWILGTGYWELVAGCWILGTGYWELVAGYWILDTGNWELGTGCWLLGAGKGGENDSRFSVHDSRLILKLIGVNLSMRFEDLQTRKLTSSRQRESTF
jgi:hypothetical protein